MHNKTLLDSLLQTGLAQFGSFKSGNGFAPVELRLEMLPSYPGLLQELAAAALQHVEKLEYDHIVCLIQSMPLGLALALLTGKPLIYSYMQELPPARSLIGAYDVGHPALLVSNTLADSTSLDQLIHQGKQVGLEIHSVLALTDFPAGHDELQSDVEIIMVLGLVEIVEHALMEGHITPSAAIQVKSWLADRP